MSIALRSLAEASSTIRLILLTQLILLLLALTVNQVAVVCLFLIAVLLPILFDGTRRDSRLLAAFYAMISVHFVVTLANALAGPVVGAELDAETFHIDATNIVNKYGFGFGFDYLFYENLLAALYYCFGSSRLVGGTTSLIVFSGAAIVYLYVIDMLRLNRYRIILLLLFGLFPSTVFMTSVTLREGWELMFLLICIYSVLKYMHGNQLNMHWLLLAFVSAVFLGMFHKALLFYGPMLVAAGLILAVVTTSTKRKRWVSFGSLLLISAMTVIFIFSIHGTYIGQRMIGGLMDEDLLTEINQYRVGIDLKGSARSAFYVPFETEGVIQSLYTFVQMYLHYMFAPIGSPPQGLKDFYAHTEALARVSGVVMYIYGIFRVAEYRSNSFVFVGLFYGSATLMWSIGTTNYGQAIRHHTFTNWALFTLAIPVFFAFARSVLSRNGNVDIFRHG